MPKQSLTLPEELRVTVPPRVRKQNFISGGANCFVYPITPRIALKYIREKEPDNRFHVENAIFDKFEKLEPSPFVIQSFLRTDVAHFMPHMLGGSLDARLRRNQEVNWAERKIVGILKLEERSLAERWTAEIAAGVAWLEAQRLAHGDLRPTNILLDDKDHCKLIDFDCAAPYGSPAHNSSPPWSRTGEDGSAGEYGVETESFAVGSIVFYIQRGYEPYGGPQDVQSGLDPVDLLKRRQFPRLREEEDVLDQIISKCWRFEYASIAALAEQTQQLEGAKAMHEAKALDKAYCEQMRQECHDLITSGLLDWPDQ